jgi:hypothetical protein
MLPKVKMPIFLLTVPFKWLMSERKNRLKITSVAVVEMLMSLKDRIKHNTIASTKSADTKRLILDSISLIPFPSYRAIYVEVDSRS